MFFNENAAAYYLTMGFKKGRRVRKIEVPSDSVNEFELGDTVADIQRKRQEREARGEEAQQQREKEARREEETRTEGTLARGGSC